MSIHQIERMSVLCFLSMCHFQTFLHPKQVTMLTHSPFSSQEEAIFAAELWSCGDTNIILNVAMQCLWNGWLVTLQLGINYWLMRIRFLWWIKIKTSVNCCINFISFLENKAAMTAMDKLNMHCTLCINIISIIDTNTITIFNCASG